MRESNDEWGEVVQVQVRSATMASDRLMHKQEREEEGGNKWTAIILYSGMASNSREEERRDGGAGKWWRPPLIQQGNGEQGRGGGWGRFEEIQSCKKNGKKREKMSQRPPLLLKWKPAWTTGDQVGLCTRPPSTDKHSTGYKCCLHFSFLFFFLPLSETFL